MRNIPIFKERFSNKKKYEVWADTGTHFRCSEFLHYLFNELSNENINVSFNLFGEQHGKSARDQHFSRLSEFIRLESLVKKLSSSQDVVDAINKHQLIANMNIQAENKTRRKSGKLLSPVVITEAFVLKFKEINIQSFRKINNIKHYYNFFNNEKFDFKSRILSSNNSSCFVKYKDIVEKDANKK